MDDANMDNELTFDITADELEIFLEDVNESLQALETGILDLEQKRDPETLNSIFRAAHTLKALAGTVGHRPMAELTHTLETLFSDMREASLSPTQAIIDELLVAVDILKSLRDEIISRQPSGVDVAALLARLHTLKDGDSTPPALSEGGTASLDTLSQLTPEQTAQVEEMAREGLTILEIEIVAAAETLPRRLVSIRPPLP